MDKVERVNDKREKVEYLSTDDARKFIEHFDSMGTQYKCIIRFLLYYGLRRGELLGLTWEDVNFEKKSFSINKGITYSKSGGLQRGHTKSDKSNRTLSLTDELIDLLMQWQKEQSQYFMPCAVTKTCYIFSSPEDMDTPLSPSVITKTIKREAERCGIKDVSPHDLRHTCATLMSFTGVQAKSIQNLLGHADISTTLKFYVGEDEVIAKEESEHYISSVFKETS